MFNSYFALTVRKLCKELLAFNIIIYGSLIFMVYWLHRIIYDPSWDDFVSALISTFATKVTPFSGSGTITLSLTLLLPLLFKQEHISQNHVRAINGVHGALTFSKI